MPSHDDFMQLALEQAKLGELAGEIPVGAVVVSNGSVVGRGHNRTIIDCDPTAHAEVVALRQAALAIGSHRLANCSLYVTLEPCPMCLGAVFHSRIGSLFFGAYDPKGGACGSVLDLASQPKLNHHCSVQGGIAQSECAQALSGFFERLRSQKRQVHRPLREDALRVMQGALDGFMPGVRAVAMDDLESAKGLRVHLWTTPDTASVPEHGLVLCLHGATSWACMFRELLQAAPVPGVAVWAIDLPGHGQSDKTKTGWEFDRKFQLALLSEVMMRSPARWVFIVGQDTGCELAAELACSGVSRIRGMALINAATRDTCFTGHVSTPGYPRSVKQLKTLIERQVGENQEHSAALLAPYAQTGHAHGVLGSFPPHLVAGENRGVDRRALPVFPGFVASFSCETLFTRTAAFNAEYGFTTPVERLSSNTELAAVSVVQCWQAALQEISSYE